MKELDGSCFKKSRASSWNLAPRPSMSLVSSAGECSPAKGSTHPASTWYLESSCWIGFIENVQIEGIHQWRDSSIIICYVSAYSRRILAQP